MRRRDSDATVSDPSATQVASRSYGYTNQYQQSSASNQQVYGSRTQRNNAYDNGVPYPGNAYGQPATPVAAPAQEQPKKKESAISMPVAIGSALSAVTSLFLSSHIGIGGSVVTVAVGAIASSLMSQAYTHIVSKSAEKMKDLSSNAGSQQLDGVMDSSQLGNYSLSEDATSAAATGTPIAPSELHDAASKRQGNVAKRRGIIITIIVALAMVLATAGIITFATQGSGIGTKTTPIIAPTSSTPSEDATATDESQVPQKDAEDTSSTDNSSEKSNADSTKSDSGKASSSSTSSNTTSNSGTSSTNSSENGKGSSSTTSGSSSNSSGSSSNGSQSNSGTSSSTNGSSNSSNASNGSASSNSGTSSNSGSNSSSSSNKESGSGTSSSAGDATSGNSTSGTSAQGSEK